MKWTFTHPISSIRSALLLILLAVLALALAAALINGSTALAGSLGQDSPVAPQHLSPLPADATPPPAAAPASPAATPQPPIPVAVIAGVMVVLVLLAILLGLRRR